MKYKHRKESYCRILDQLLARIGKILLIPSNVVDLYQVAGSIYM